MIAGSGGPTSASGPLTERDGSIRRSAFRNPPDGGATSFSATRIDERCTASRISRAFWPGAFRATAPNTHAATSASPRNRSAPPAESAIRVPPRRGDPRAQAAPRALERDGQEQAQAGSLRPPRRRARTGTPLLRREATAPASRPRRYPPTKPARGRAERTRPRSHPIAAIASANTAIPMSIGLTSAASGHYFSPR